MEIEPSFAIARRLLRARPRVSPSLATVYLIALFALAQPGGGQSLPEADGYRWIRPSVVNLRSGGGTQFDAIGQLRRGDRVWLVHVDQGWAEVQIPTDDGWQRGFVRFDLLAESDPTGYVKGNEPRQEIDHDGNFQLVVLIAALSLVIVIAFRRLLRGRTARVSRTSQFQNRGEEALSRLLERHFAPPDYHLMNHITLRFGSGTTQIDHVLVSRFGVFVIETKDYKGWIFGSPNSQQWTQVLHKLKFRFQNPILQNKKHVRAVEDLLAFLPAGSVRSIVVFVGVAEIKTPMPEFVLYSSEVVHYVRKQSATIVSRDQLQLCVGRLETARLAVTGETDLEHIRNVERWHGHKG
jgi:hypothetical protein